MKTTAPSARLLALHQWLFGAAIWLAVHKGGIRELWLLLALALLNALLWLGFTRRTVPRNAPASTLGTLLLAVPCLAVLGGFGLFNLARGGHSLASWPVEAAGIGVTVLVAAWVFSATRDLRPFLAAVSVASVAIVAEGMWALVQRGHLSLIVTLGGLRRNVGPDFPTFRMGYDQLPYVNVLASLLMLFASLSLSLTALARTRAGRAGAWAATAVTVAGVLLTGSRGGTIVLMLLLLTHAAYRLRVWRLSTAAGIVLLAAAGAAIALRPGGFLRGSGSLRARFHTFRVALGIARDHPFLGGGRGAFKEAWAEYGPWHGYGFRFTSVDGTYFWALSVGGVTLLAAVLGLVGTLLWETTRAARLAANQPVRHALFAFGAAAGALMVHGALESNLESRATYLVGCVLGGLLVAMRRRPEVAEPSGLAWSGSSYRGGAGQRESVGPSG